MEILKNCRIVDLAGDPVSTLIGVGLKCGKHVAEFFYQQAAVNLISLKVISQDIHPLGAFHLSIICVFPTFMCICLGSGPIWR